MITNYKGATIDVFNLKEEDICIEDIILALPNICRYGGRISNHYSVAQHAVELVRWLRANDKEDLIKLALLHDGCEAYIGDIIYPIKTKIPLFMELETKITNLIYKKFNVDTTLFDYFDYYDKNIVVNEMKAVGLHKSDSHLISHLEELEGLIIKPWSAEKARSEFVLELFNTYSINLL